MPFLGDAGFSVLMEDLPFFLSLLMIYLHSGYGEGLKNNDIVNYNLKTLWDETGFAPKHSTLGMEKLMCLCGSPPMHRIL